MCKIGPSLSIGALDEGKMMRSLILILRLQPNPYSNSLYFHYEAEKTA